MEAVMKNPLELIEEREGRITQLKREISALRIAISLLLEDKNINEQKETEQLRQQASSRIITQPNLRPKSTSLITDVLCIQDGCAEN
jgi:regulator of replication initiation timing